MARKGLKENQILVIIKEPGKPAYVEPVFDNTLEAFQRAVGGYIETVAFATDAVLIVNEEGAIMAPPLPENVVFCGYPIRGTVVVAGVKGDEFASLKAGYIPLLLKELNLNAL